MKCRNKMLSLLLVSFIVGVNSLTACGQNSNGRMILTADLAEADSLTVSEEIGVTSNALALEKNADKAKTHENNEVENEDEFTAVDKQDIAERLLETERESVEKQSSFSQYTPGNTPVQPVINEPEQENVEVPAVNPHADATTVITDSFGITEPAENQPDEPALSVVDSASDAVETREPIPSHEHSYSSSIVGPTCTTGGYTLYYCSCGDSYKAEETAALGHDWVTHTERIMTGQEAHEICGDCGMDLTANGISGGAIVQHAKQHVLSDENASGRTFTSLVESFSDVTVSICSRCGETQ